MVRPRRQRGGRRWVIGLLAGLILAGLSRPGYGLEGPGPPGEEDRPSSSATRLHLTVCQGRLSVDLVEAEVGEVLARIAQEASLALRGVPRAGIRVSAQFADMALDYGLRRLLQRASLSHAFRYAQASTGALIVHEVWVFEGMQEESPSPPSVAGRDLETRAAEASSHGPHAAGQVGEASTDFPREKAAAVWRQIRDRYARAAFSRTGRRPAPPPAN